MALVGAGPALGIRRTTTDLVQEGGRNPGVVHSCGHRPQFIPSPGELIEASLTPGLLLSMGTDGHLQRMTRMALPKEVPGSESARVALYSSY